LVPPLKLLPERINEIYLKPWTIFPNLEYLTRQLRTNTYRQLAVHLSYVPVLYKFSVKWSWLDWVDPSLRNFLTKQTAFIAPLASFSSLGFQAGEFECLFPTTGPSSSPLQADRGQPPLLATTTTKRPRPPASLTPTESRSSREHFGH